MKIGRQKGAVDLDEDFTFILSAVGIHWRVFQWATDMIQFENTNGEKNISHGFFFILNNLTILACCMQYNVFLWSCWQGFPGSL